MSRRLQFQGEKSPSFAPKIAITCWYILCFAAAANPGRQVALLACVLLYVARAAATLFVFVKRKIPWWEAAWGGIPIGLVIFFSLRGGLRTPEPLGFLDVPGGLLYGILTQLPWMAIVTLAMALNFVLFIIPAHDAYLVTRYDGEFEEYARRTRKLVPLLY